jgi:acetylornithine deacetylase/succinyl-diaminopimelate desuccinylase-like protein
MINDDNAVTRLAGAVGRIGAHQWPVRLTPTMEVLLATIDGRFLPGYEDEFFATLHELAGDGIELDFESKQDPWETPYDGDLVAAMTRSLMAEDPDALVAPFLMSGGTDAKHFRKLDMRSYGFAPLRLPADLDFTALFHGVDERVPVDALEFGARVFDRFLDDI